MESKSSNIKVALITGSARRIGAVIARQLHAAGFNVVLHCLTSIEAAEQHCLELNNKRHHSAVVIAADLRTTAGLSLLLEKTLKEWGRLDVLVNNASNFIKTPLDGVQEQLWDELMGCNLKAPFFLSTLARPYLTQTHGCIVNITDIHIDSPLRDYAVYCISKAGLVSLTKVMAKELGPHVRVNAISPGMMMWPEGKNELAAELQEKILNEAILKRIGDPLDIAKAVLFLVNDADFITGQVLAVDGGRLL